MGRQQADRIVAAFLSRLCRRRHGAGGVSCRASQSAGKARGWDLVLAIGRERRGCLCFARLVRLAGSGADLALSGRAPDGAGTEIVRRRTRRADRYAQCQVRELAGAEKTLDVVENDSRAARVE